MKLLKYINYFFQKRKNSDFDCTFSIDINLLRKLMDDIQARLEYIKTSKSVFNTLYILFVKFFSIKTPEDIVYEKFYLLLSKKITIIHSNTQNHTLNENEIRKKIYETSLKVYYSMKNTKQSPYLKKYISTEPDDVKKFFSLFENIEKIISEEINSTSELFDQCKPLLINVTNDNNNSENCDNFNSIKNKILCINNFHNQHNEFTKIKEQLSSNNKKIKYITQFRESMDKFNQSVSEKFQDQNSKTSSEIIDKEEIEQQLKETQLIEQLEQSTIEKLVEIYQNKIQVPLIDFIKNNRDILSMNETENTSIIDFFHEVYKKIDLLCNIIYDITYVVVETYGKAFGNWKINDLCTAVFLIAFLKHNTHDIGCTANELKYSIPNIVAPFETIKGDFEHLLYINKNHNLHSNTTTFLPKIDQEMKIESININETQNINIQC